MNKRGIFFTFIAIMLVGFIIVAFTQQAHITLRDKVPITQARVQTADDYVKNLKYVYLERSVIHSSIAALKATALYLNYSNNDYFSDKDELNDVFTEIMLNGTVDQIEVDALIGRPGLQGNDQPVMRNNNLTYRLKLISNASQEVLFINTTFHNTYTDYKVVLFQDNDTGPFRVGVNVSFDLTVAGSIARWNESYNLTIFLEIEGLDDPLYMIGQQDVYVVGDGYTNKIRETNISVWNTTATGWFLSNQTYIYDNEAPSYLQRFYDDTTPSVCCGMMSVVNPIAFGHGSSERMRSYVDYCFYHPGLCQEDPLDLFYVNGVTDAHGGSHPGIPNLGFFGFKLDALHLAHFNLTDAGLTEQVGTP